MIVAMREGRDYLRDRIRLIDHSRAEGGVSIFPDSGAKIDRTSRNRSASEESFQHRHASGDPVRHLTQDADATMLVGHRIINLDAPVHRAGVEHNGMRFQAGSTIGCESE